MRSLDWPEGFWNLPPHRAEKVRLGNAMAEACVKLCQAQERVKGAWQWEQPWTSLMFYMRNVCSFFSKLELFWAEVWVCAFGLFFFWLLNVSFGAFGFV